MIMTAEQIKEYLKQRQKQIKNNVAIAQEQNNIKKEIWYTAQYMEISNILESIR